MINAGTNKQALIAMGKKLHGSSLIEVLIALLVLSFGMMGMAGVQSVSLRGNQAA
jgi:type IV pilus assembly protein PilV